MRVGIGLLTKSKVVNQRICLFDDGFKFRSGVDRYSWSQQSLEHFEIVNIY